MLSSTEFSVVWSMELPPAEWRSNNAPKWASLPPADAAAGHGGPAVVAPMAVAYDVVALCLWGSAMDDLYVVGTLVTIGLFVYLVAAMLKPEWFE